MGVKGYCISIMSNNIDIINISYMTYILLHTCNTHKSCSCVEPHVAYVRVYTFTGIHAHVCHVWINSMGCESDNPFTFPLSIFPSISSKIRTFRINVYLKILALGTCANFKEFLYHFQ